MSRSSLWTMDEAFYGTEEKEYGNAWLFAPVAWEMLFRKYLPEKTVGPFGQRLFMTVSRRDTTISPSLNDAINDSPFQPDRVVWEMSTQQVFFSKDKQFVADAIREFVSANADCSEFEAEHIRERFLEIAADIEALDEKESPYFIFKNTSVDDNVEYWFRRYDEDGDSEKRALSEVDQDVTEFVVVEGGHIERFVANTEYFSKEKPA